MNICRKLKDNRFLRGLYCIWGRNFGGLKRGLFGYIADNVMLTHPIGTHEECVYL